ncbi:MAG: glutamine--tRNA ligase/YqeY domain fusion protein [Methylotenera sp.]|nr:glutamine--tRNA ligase/YqeY domain fusion protein [Oligoflexia bacterium]
MTENTAQASAKPETALPSSAPSNFIRTLITEDLRVGKHGGQVATRFPPEPNGYLHIGHAKSICLNFGLARDFKGTCNLRFDDTNPVKEDVEYVDSIQADVKWLGFEWSNKHFASDYFEQIYGHAVQLIQLGKAYVCSLNAEQMRKYRGTLTEPGKESPDRDRSVEDNLNLFDKMRKGEFPDGAYTLRAKIDMGSPNLNLRDPALYRIRRAHHHRTGDDWCIYPMYDYAHPISDMIEGITHSICTLEFADHRPFYDWLLDTLKTPCHPQQIEFSRLNINYTVMSKRKLHELVVNRHVSGWDDPRMLTIQGLRRRGYPAAALRDFCERVGVTKKENCIEMAMLESCVREDLDKNAPRAMAVLRPLRLVIENYPEGQVEEFEVQNHPSRTEMGSRKVAFSKVVYIEQEDFMEVPEKKFFRLAPGQEVRLRSAYYVKCTDVIKDASGKITEVRCTYDPETKGGWHPGIRKVKGTLHWVSETHSKKAEIRLYDRLFSVPFPGEGDTDFLQQMNPQSLEVLSEARVEPSLMEVAPEASFQFERQGFFVADRMDSKPGKPVFNRTVTLKDGWARENAPNVNSKERE